MYRKNTAFRIVCALALVIMMLPLSVVATAQETKLTTVVPATHSLSIEINGKGIVSVDGEQYSKSKQIQILRHSGPLITVKAADGYQIKTVHFDGENITNQFSNGTWSMPAIISDVVLTVAFVEQNSTPATGDVSNILLWIEISLLALVGLSLCIVSYREKRTKYL